MINLAKALIGVSAIAFVLAVVCNFTGTPIMATARGFSNASTNLALLAIALATVFSHR